MKKTLLTLLLVSSIGILKIEAQTPTVLLSDKWEWYKIADKTVIENGSRDEIAINGIEHYTAIKVKVIESGINLYDLELTYAGGNGQVINVSTTMKAGEQTQVYGLDGSKRDLKKICFAFESQTTLALEKTQIEVWGLRTILD
jgi:hypothetical protein